MGNKIVKVEDIKRRIYSFRGMQVMLDRDLAELYQVKPRRLREQVKRNIKRFPDDFMFQLTENELDVVVSQNAIPSKQSFGGSLPYVFTEQGVASLSGVLTSDIAIDANISIMRAFVQTRKFMLQNANIFQKINHLEIKQLEADQKFNKIFEALNSNTIVIQQQILFEGQFFDAHTFVSDLVRSAKTSIMLIDNYVDDRVLTLLDKREKGVRAKIYTKNISKKLKLDVEKHNQQYPKIEIQGFDRSHDRFLILDETEVYHIGASLKDLGKKWFAFSKIEMEARAILERLS